MAPQPDVRDGEQRIDGELSTPLVVQPNTEREIPWERRAAALFRARILDDERPFPCTFGVGALRRCTLRYAFVPEGAHQDRALAAALDDFVALAPSLGKRTSLVVFFEPSRPYLSLDGYRERFWQLLQALHNRDPSPWPEGIAADPEACDWEFSYHGLPMFVVANTPRHHRRASRYFEYFTITFQPRFVFDDLGVHTPYGMKARSAIRKRLRAYDSVPSTPLLGGFGVPGNKEWVQYFLDDDNAGPEPGARCPLRMHT